ncbi:MAG: UDP-N-acetylmuramate:L-alanyl-gamma-D-glutamyl-meso-diaminopimelate ligase [Candidatus Competibacteraceae bacterium]|nr:UDP-N-acetylmuramate:L-alanyl-gamma-D-glutamyl-meso-diaminopimelate ligase [Candidatus Competibacteraceae bacterium]MBK7984252.1 UDP-N-acetylmuramate:L-alanyl-gamma-D-glutamyl-meso-diaminopimelate ligase [Candidatus Competibacteraceae bacterium]MBK8896219.1 UDP-N-acetylmuramate:L-alanyl-gamma-D-glutamyl-meso-diaminopimelate ligase [Candidatus Competibacteraceae bacterium]MBK8964971.1 UDP-N-acetylmuramate:L-alanyl-gamma-D-glutamyl-meso-diaminopimelate ligase [Candidatus Competibacteraceae bact
MHIHILGICGTFMAGVALLARAAGHTVSGCDANVYPPMSTQLAEAGIALREGYDPGQLVEFKPDMIVVGNVMSRGRPIVETMLDGNLPYTSGPAWLAEYVLRDRHVLAVAGTHGKTTTSSLLAWILEDAGLEPGFLIGGIPANFGQSARLGRAPFFVVEADEYDTAFFDKRSKFVHYRPRTLVLNNLEFDHADIFPDLAAIQRQFHHLLRTVPGAGLVVANGDDANLTEVLALGCWTPVEKFGARDWEARDCAADGSTFEVCYHGVRQGRVAWTQSGAHNVHNALAAIAAARHAGVPSDQAIRALARFEGVKRRLETRGTVNGVTVYDDFAHHPTAIATTLAGLRARVGDRPIIAVLEPRSNTMKLGVFKDSLAPALAAADAVVLYQAPDLGWNLDAVAAALGARGQVCHTLDDTLAAIRERAEPSTQVLIMSNGGFGGIHERLLKSLRAAGG